MTEKVKEDFIFSVKAYSGVTCQVDKERGN